MAKDKKAAAQPAAPAKQEFTVEGIEDQIKNLNRSNEDIALAAKEEQAKSDEKEKIRKTRRAQARARYTNLYSLIGLKRARKIEAIEKDFLTKTKEVLDGVESGKITFNESEKKTNDLFDERRKEFGKIDEWANSMKKELDDSFSNTYDIYDIDWRMDRGRGRQLW